MALGIITRILSGVLTIVLKIRISLTAPFVPAASMKSPTLKGLKIIIRKPEAKFASEPWSASPIARPAAPRTTANCVVSIPTAASEAITTKTNAAI